MPKADSVRSTPPTNTSARHSRRSILGAIAAGGAVAAVAGIPAAAPSIASGLPAPDPVFAAIAAHKEAIRALMSASAEQNRFLALADETVGTSSIKVLDMREPSTPPGWHPYVEVDCWIDIEKYVAQAEHPELYAHCRADLEERQAERAKFLEETAGDIDEIMNGPTKAECEAADELTDVVPTTLPGLLAMLSYVHGAMKQKGDVVASFDESNYTVLLGSLGKAAKALAQVHQ
jgi:hypothetical protein